MIDDLAQIMGIEGGKIVIEPPDRCFGLTREPRDVGDLANYARAMERISETSE